MAHYKRGIVSKDGKEYGRYPDGTLYRIYSIADRPFLQIVQNDQGDTILRIRQSTEQGYTDCHVFGVCDLAYPSSTLRRSRTIMGGDWRTLSLVTDSNFLCSLNYRNIIFPVSGK